MTPLAARQALDSYFLEARCKILEVAAVLDRIDRGRDAAALAEDSRMKQLRQALEILHDESGGRAERIQRVFSLEYEPAWERPEPR